MLPGVLRGSGGTGGAAAPPRLSRCYGQPRNGGVDPAGKQATGCLQLYRAELPPRSAADRRGGWSERGQELGPRELRRPVSRQESVAWELLGEGGANDAR